MDPYGESPRPREEFARAVNISCLVIPFEWSGELWPVGLALCLNPQLVVVVTRMPLSTVPPDFIQIMAFMNAIAPGRVVEGWVMDERRMAGAFNRDFLEQLRVGGQGGLALEDTGLTLKESSVAGLAERGLFFSAAAATQFYLPHVAHIPRIAKDWAALGGDVSRFVDQVPNVPMILVWFRAPKFGEPHQDFTVAGPSYGEDWLAVVNEMAAAAGIIWTTVGGSPAAPDAYSCFLPIPVLNNLWSLLPSVKEARAFDKTYSLTSKQTGRTNRLVQFAFFFALAGRGNIFACTWRSGSAEGCFLFTGMPTVVLDASNESGFKRAASMCGALGNAHHVAVDREGAVGVRAALGGLLGLRVERPAREEDPHRDRRERERRDRDDSPGRDRERDRERDENRDRDRRDRERRERAPLDPAPRDRDRDRDRERDRDDRDRRAPTWCYDCDARITERCRHCRRYVCDRCYRRGHQGGRCD